MKCYICAEKGEDTDAVATCVICGMGVCMEHLIRQELWNSDARAMLPRIICIYCKPGLPPAITPP